MTPKDGKFPKVMQFKKRTLPDSFLKEYPNFLFCHPKYEASLNGDYAKLIKDNQASFKVLSIKDPKSNTNHGILRQNKNDIPEAKLVNSDENIGLKNDKVLGNSVGENFPGLNSIAKVMLSIQD